MLDGELLMPVVRFFMRYFEFHEEARQMNWSRNVALNSPDDHLKADLLLWTRPDRSAAVAFEHSVACAIGAGKRGVLRIWDYPANERWVALPRHAFVEDQRGDLERQCRHMGVGLILVWGNGPAGVADWWVLPRRNPGVYLQRVRGKSPQQMGHWQLARDG